MRKREILEQYRDIVLEIKSLERQAEFLTRDIGGPKPIRGVQLTGMPRGTNDQEAAALQTIEDGIIESISIRRTRNIIRDYYASGMTDEAIAADQGLSASRVNQIRLDYLKEIDNEK